MQTFHKTCRRPESASPSRRGSVFVLFAILMIVVFAFTAYAVDVGSVALTKHQLQNAADAAAHAATLELRRGFGLGAELTQTEAEASARAMAVDMINRHKSGDLQSTPADLYRDVRFGRRYWDETTNAWVEDWGVGPFNMAEVTVRRIREDGSQLPLAFAAVLGHDDVEVMAQSTKALYPVGGFSIPDSPSGASSARCDLLPFTCDLSTWTALLNGDDTNPYIDDEYAWDPVSETVSLGTDGTLDINMYPDLLTNLPPGNRGMVDLGAPNNSTMDVKRQIVEGLNEYDFSFFPNNTITLEYGPIYLNGDTGISAGMKAELESIIGELRAIPIFIEVSGNGNNAMYTIVKFVGIRIMDVKLTGGPNNRYFRVQPVPFSCQESFRVDGPIFTDSILSGPVSVH